MSDEINTLIVGGGLAGLSAAIEAYRRGSAVLIVDKEKNLGGNSAKATSGMNSVQTPAQVARSIADSADAFTADTIKSGGGRSRPVLVHTLAANAHDAHAWLETFGITLDSVSQCGGHSVPRTHRESPRPDGKPAPVGWDIIKVLRAYIDAEIAAKTNEKFGSFRIVTQTRVMELIEKDGHVVGIRGVHTADGSAVEYRADAVVLTTGGFSADSELLHAHAAHIAHFPTTNGPWAAGDGIKITRNLSIDLTDMDQVQLHPTGFVDPAHPDAPTVFLAPEALRGHGGVLLSTGTGSRFTNELGTRAAVVADILKHSQQAIDGVIDSSFDVNDKSSKWPRAGAFMVLNQAAVDAFDPATIGFYASRGFFRKATGPAELAALLNSGMTQGVIAPKATEAGVKDTLLAYTAAAEGASADAHGKTVFPVKFTAAADEAYHVCAITPAIHYTMGGIKINAAAEVLRKRFSSTADLLTAVGEVESGAPAPGLFAAGEVTGGVHGKNRLAGNSLLECVVFGRIAGARAAAVTQHAGLPALVPDAFTALQLRSVTKVGGAIKLFRFSLPSPHHSTGLDVGQYVAVRATIHNEPLVRYYSPISRADDPGHIDLLIKTDDAGGMAQHIDSLVPGLDSLEFKGPLGTTFPDLGLSATQDARTGNGVDHIVLVAGGTGISPMIQVIRSVLFHERADLQVKLMYGAAAPEELVYRDVLEEKAREHENLKLYLTVDHPNDAWPKGNPSYGTGYMSAEVFKRELPPPGDNLRIIICGPWKMCQIIKKTLVEIGYPEGMWFCYM